MLRTGNIIKHKNFMDVAIIVNTCDKYGSYYMISGEFINQGFDETYPMGQYKTFKIETNKLSDWSVCTQPSTQCIRYSNWKELK